MNWAVFAIASWLLFGAELGMRIALGPSWMAPSFVLPLLVFVGLFAQPVTVYWAALALGLVTDLTNLVEAGDGGGRLFIVGPYALGYLVAGQLVLTLRGIMIRRNPLTMGFLAIVASIVAHIVVIAFMTAHKLYGEPVVWTAGTELAHRLGMSVATGVSAFALSLLFFPLSPALGLATGQPRRFARRMA